MASTIIEKVIHVQTRYLIDFNKDLEKKFSTNSCLSYLSNKITTSFESGFYTGMVWYSLISKRHLTQLITKFSSIKWNSKDVVLWFKSYPSNRKFKINLNKTFLEPGNLLCVVPQRSTLSPLLFYLYINDMPQAAKCELFVQYDIVRRWQLPNISTQWH